VQLRDGVDQGGHGVPHLRSKGREIRSSVEILARTLLEMAATAALVHVIEGERVEVDPGDERGAAQNEDSDPDRQNGGEPVD
jgi:hypothetical protein